jgi:hypothetical protein
MLAALHNLVRYSNRQLSAGSKPSALSLALTFHSVEACILLMIMLLYPLCQWLSQPQTTP